MANQPIDSVKEESLTDAMSRRAKGEFVRGVSGFRSAVGEVDFPSESGRYIIDLGLYL